MQEFRPPAGAARLAARLTRRPSRERQEAKAKLERGEASRLLVVKPHDQLGDFLVATPAINALRARYPNARITLVTREYLAPLAKRQPAVDEVVVLPRGGWALARVVDLVGSLGAPRPDAAFVLNSVSRSRTADLVAATSGASLIVGRSAVGAGPPSHAAPGKETVYDVDIPVTAMHQVDRLLELVRWTGADAPPRMTLAATRGSRGEGKRIGFHPTAANALKCWPLDSFVELARRLSGDATLVVFDTPKEPGPARRMHEDLPHAEFVPAGPLDEFFAPVAGLDLMVCNDSGVMHVAAALGVPVLSLHSLGRPEVWAPRSETAIALHGEPIGAITVDGAERAARKLL
jgi:heptosyltransferase-2